MACSLDALSPGNSDSLALMTTNGEDLANDSRQSHLDTPKFTVDQSVENRCVTKTLSSERSLPSSITTLEPFIPPSTKGRRRGRGMNIPLTTEVKNYEKYLTLELDSDEVDIFAVHKDIVKHCGRRPKISPQNNKKILICTESQEESDKLKELKDIGGISVKCEPHFNLNHSKGLIYAPQLMPYTEKKLEEELKSEGVVKVERMKKKVDGVLIPQPGLILTFSSLELPHVISAAWYNFKIKQYIPRPRRCYYCQQFGHVITSCRHKELGKDPVCANCSNIEHGFCNNDPKCVHCGGKHPSSSFKCDVFIMEQEIQAVRVIEKISFAEARSKVMAKFIRPGVSFSSVVSNRNMFQKSHANKQGRVFNSGQKRTLSNESLSTERPSKLQSSKDTVLSNSPLPDLSVDDNTLRKSRSSEITTSSESIQMETQSKSDDIPVHPDPEPTSVLTSLEVGPELSGPPALVEPDLSGSPVSVEPDLSGPLASSEAIATAVTDPVTIAVDVHSPPKSDGWWDMQCSVKENVPENRTTKAVSGTDSSGKPIPSATKLANSKTSKGKPQRILQRNPPLQGPKKI